MYLLLYLLVELFRISYSLLYLLWLAAIRISGFPFTTRQLTFQTPSIGFSTSTPHTIHTLCTLGTLTHRLCINFFVYRLTSISDHLWFSDPGLHASQNSQIFLIFQKSSGTAIRFWSSVLWVRRQKRRRSLRSVRPNRFKLDQRCWTTNAFLSTSTWFRH